LCALLTLKVTETFLEIVRLIRKSRSQGSTVAPSNATTASQSESGKEQKSEKKAKPQRTSNYCVLL
jgi:hypothetical protein